MRLIRLSGLMTLFILLRIKAASRLQRSLAIIKILMRHLKDISRLEQEKSFHKEICLSLRLLRKSSLSVMK